jgi:hypothetical protein
MYLRSIVLYTSTLFLITVLVMVPPVVSDDGQGSLKPRHANYTLTEYKNKLNTQMQLKVLKTLARRRIATAHARNLLSTEDPDLMAKPVPNNTHLTDMEHSSNLDADLEDESYLDADQEYQDLLDADLDASPDYASDLDSSLEKVSDLQVKENASGSGSGRRLLTATTTTTATLTTTPKPHHEVFTTGELIALIVGGALAILVLGWGIRYTQKNRATTNNDKPPPKIPPTNQDRNELTQPLVKHTTLNVQGFLEFPTRV